LRFLLFVNRLFLIGVVIWSKRLWKRCCLWHFTF